jgi:hypothetical protein
VVRRTLGPFPERNIVIDLDMILESILVGHETRYGDGTTMNIHTMASGGSMMSADSQKDRQERTYSPIFSTK